MDAEPDDFITPERSYAEMAAARTTEEWLELFAWYGRMPEYVLTSEEFKKMFPGATWDRFFDSKKPT